MSPPYERIIVGFPVENVRFLLLSTNLARERLQIDTYKHCWRAFRGYQDRWHWTTLNPKIWVFSEFFTVLGCDAHLESEFLAEITGNRPRQPAYEIKLMLSRVSWALAQIYCFNGELYNNNWPISAVTTACFQRSAVCIWPCALVVGELWWSDIVWCSHYWSTHSTSASDIRAVHAIHSCILGWRRYDRKHRTNILQNGYW